MEWKKDSFFLTWFSVDYSFVKTFIDLSVENEEARAPLKDLFFSPKVE